MRSNCEPVPTTTAVLRTTTCTTLWTGLDSAYDCAVVCLLEHSQFWHCAHLVYPRPTSIVWRRVHWSGRFNGGTWGLFRLDGHRHLEVKKGAAVLATMLHGIAGLIMCGMSLLGGYMFEVVLAIMLSIAIVVGLMLPPVRRLFY